MALAVITIHSHVGLFTQAAHLEDLGLVAAYKLTKREWIKLRQPKVRNRVVKIQRNEAMRHTGINAAKSASCISWLYIRVKQKYKLSLTYYWSSTTTSFRHICLGIFH